LFVSTRPTPDDILHKVPEGAQGGGGSFRGQGKTRLKRPKPHPIFRIVDGVQAASNFSKARLAPHFTN
jgi:hypothetical protein